MQNAWLLVRIENDFEGRSSEAKAERRSGMQAAAFGRELEASIVRVSKSRR
jgi:hypothetical protein